MPNTYRHKILKGIFLFLLFGPLFVVFLSPPSLHALPSQLKDPKKAYLKAFRAYKRLSRNPRLRKYRHSWLRVIGEYREIYLTWPEDKTYAPKSLYMMAGLYRGLYGYSGKINDLKEALGRYEVLYERFPNSTYADDALYHAGVLYRRLGKRKKAKDCWKRIILRYPGSDYYNRAVKQLGRIKPKKQEVKRGAKSTSSKPSFAIVKGIRYWSKRDYTRVVIDATNVVHYYEGTLPRNKRRRLPKRLYIDIAPARVSKGLKHSITIGDGLLKRIRVAQFNRDTVRIVFDLGRTERYKIFHLEEPFRVVVDAFGKRYQNGGVCPPPKGRFTLTQQLGLCVRRIVIDPGHGGKDPGAIGPTGLREKDVTLKVARFLKKELERRLGVRVILTRYRDVYIPLTQRAAIANANKADLFISIHCNAAPDRRTRGVETYFLNFALDKEAMRVAALENATSKKRIGELRGILTKIMKNTKVAESKRLSQYIQKDLVKALGHSYSRVDNLGVKQAPFFVLIGARMPSVLTEISFISNRKEEQKLKDSRYLRAAARGIAMGIEDYIRDTELIASNRRARR